MKLIFFMSLMVGFLFGPEFGHAYTCPEWIAERQGELPECPEGGVVPESFPLGAVVVSDDPTHGKRKSDFTADVVKKVLRNAGDKNPLVVLPVSEETLKHVKAEIQAMDVSPEMKEKWLKSIVHVPGASYTWQQDFMQPFIDRNSGKLQLRKVDGYFENRRMPDLFQKITGQLKKCGIASGPLLKTPEQGQGFKSGHAGGNIETLPGGICLLGDDDLDPDRTTSTRWKEYADQICEPGEENRIKVPTHWLFVGHTDEIVKVLPNKTQEKPCDFSIAISSPRKALEILRKNSQDNFFEFETKNKSQLKKEFSRKIWLSSSLTKLCNAISRQRDERSPERRRQQDERSSRAISELKRWHQALIQKAQAGSYISEYSSHTEDCMNITNGEVAELFSPKQSAGDYNNGIQAELDRFKQEMKNKLSQKMPQCEIDIFEVPDLYIGGYTLRMGGVTSELSRHMGVSLMPNSTNGITVNNASIHSDPHVGAFKKYISEENKKRGLNTEFVDTFEYAHVGFGNLHCSTNTMYMCKPRGAK